jgi:calcineurin-like phosphoesterase family protein
MDWITSDHHFGHVNIIKHCSRPFASVEEMDERLIANWNERIGPRDTVYHLGDIIFRSAKAPEAYLNRLNGSIHLLRGNHDSETIKSCAYRFASIREMLVYRMDRQKVILCHYALRLWEGSHLGTWHLYGHAHGTLPPAGLSFDIGVDTHDFLPWAWPEIKLKIAELRAEEKELFV